MCVNSWPTKKLIVKNVHQIAGTGTVQTLLVVLKHSFIQPNELKVLSTTKQKLKQFILFKAKKQM